MWAGFDAHHNYFTIYLSQYFNISIDPRPDFLIHSVYGKDYLRYNCCRICFSGENQRPDFSRSDYHIGFDYNDQPSYLRWPLFLLGGQVPGHLLKEKNIDAVFAEKKRFCSFVVSNEGAKERVNLFTKLSTYKKVDSGGRFLNNIGGPVANKLDFLKESKFNIAFENASYPGYTTEKIFDAFLSNSIPIYWGNPRINEDFNDKSFINVNDFKTTEELIKYIQFLDENETAYKAILSESAFPDNRIPEKFQFEKFIAFFNNIFNNCGVKKRVHSFRNTIEYMNYKARKKVFELRQTLQSK